MKNDNLEKAAKFLLAHIGSLDPTWKSRLEILKSERGFTDVQALGSMVGYALERGEHLLCPTHPYFEPDYHGAATGDVAICACGQAYKVAYPGQPYCSNACAMKYRKV